MTTVIEGQGPKERGAAPHSTARLAAPSRPRAAAFSWAALAREQAGRPILWGPLAVMAGAAFYFTAPTSPPAALGPALLAVAVIACWLLATRQTAHAGGPAD
ncbi:MAG TPA: hypothetical protein VG735_04380, partial [Caulobacterales bacterium]|nr:hypothetical protein [Caulobacterales bacterium]